jgi:digeranylgeranylglycerophospholipid reductase
LKVLVLDKREEIGVPVQCGEYLADRKEVNNIFPLAKGLDELDYVTPEIIQRQISAISIFSPKGREYRIPFSGYTVNRDALDNHFASLAEKAGAEIQTGVVVKGLSGNEVLTDKGRFDAKVIVGADGPRSIIARSANLEPPTDTYPALTCQVDGDFSSILEMHFGSVAPGGYAWIIPKNRCANVGLGAWKRLQDNSLRKLFNDFMTHRGFTPRSVAGGLVPISGPAGRTVSGNVVIVGDAAGHVMATNGGGVNAAMICGRIAGECIGDHLLKNEPLQNYEERWREVVGDPLDIGVRIKRLADRFFGSDFLLENAMRLLGPRRMARALRCKRLFRK